MQPNPDNLLRIAGITTPLIGFYDVADTKPFEPFSTPERCYFSSYENWLKGESICISEGNASCQGGGYWVGGVLPAWAIESAGSVGDPMESFAKRLNQREGFKSSDELMCRWFESQKPYLIENGFVVIGPLVSDQYEHLKTVTFYINPDQLSLLILGAEYNNTSVENHPVIVPFGSGCGQMAALFSEIDSDKPQAVIGATDIAMREHFPPDILAFTVNKPLFKQICELSDDSFLYKSFWKRLQKARGEMLLDPR
jgi:hypothetical protein